ncbi:non-ribosomal peptide synthetase [Paenibacillus alvei]|uniref:non-ribosomal peptide synthetase n=1 Tax=Paenibacillus alvei TaxID=44250 RepID=UPI0018CE882A|nr:non-ribosomal peptide synthetase [Paenibacillus alvei]MBG9733430.1 hypothetical protein [Paenibacillus alvei]MBG9742715.1 hypothetical protein [Paenibacillus alvei]MCY9581459.1 non-ribosomal peptide synthetase [Paenibacillus alvei]MCY9585533.1 non-ribosomal peptide synthetase [Paenibacillus alvei]
MEFRRLTDMLHAVRRQEDRGITFIQGGEKEHFLSYKNLYDRALHLIGYFQEKGIVPGDEILFQIEDEELFIQMFWACVLGGFIPVPVSVGSNDEHKRKLFHIWDVLKRPVLLIAETSYSYVEAFSKKADYQDRWTDMKKRTLFADSIDFASCRPGAVHEAEPSDTAFIQFSSGSTGEPKGVILTHDNLLSNILAMINRSAIGSADSTLSWMPLTHDMGLIGCHMVPIAAQIQQYLMPTSLFIRRPTLWMAKCSEHRSTILSSPNFGYQYFLGKFKQEAASAWNLSHVRLIFNGAEPISAELAARFMAALAPCGLKQNAMFPVYGMAEACLAVTFPPVGDELNTMHLNREHLSLGSVVKETEAGEGVSFVDVGSPVDDCCIYIGDSSGTELAELIIGEIYLKGRNVTSGYYNNESATAERITSTGWLRTGDLGFMRNGRLYVTGRVKDILFVNGQNVYPHDIERVCEAVEPIKLGTIAACGVSNPEAASDDLLLFVLYRGKLEDFAPLAITLRSHVQRQLGITIEHVVPVTRLPKTTSGKIQRYKLGEWYRQQHFAEVIEQVSGYVQLHLQERQLAMPVSGTEERLLEICCRLLGVNEIGTLDSLFDWGGNSLQLTYLIANIRAEFGVKISLYDIFHQPTIRQIAHLIEHAQASDTDEVIMEVVPSKRSIFPTTPPQRRIYAWQQLNKQGVSYNITAILKLEGPLFCEQVEKAWSTLVKRHGALRTYFDFQDGEPVQQIAAVSDLAVRLDYEEVFGCIDIPNYADSFVRPHDLHHAPLWRTKLCKTSEDQHLFLIDIHHIVIDGTSMHIIMSEFVQLLLNQSLGPSPLSFADYALWREKQPLSEEHQAYWLAEMSGELPILEMPTCSPRPALLSGAGDHYFDRLNKELAERCRSFAREQCVSVYMVLLAAYKLMLAQCTGQQNLVVGTSSAGRTIPGTERTAGMFVQTLAIRSQPEGHKTVSEYVREIKEKTLLALEHQDYPFERLLEKLPIRRDASRNPLFDTMFVYQNMDKAAWRENELHIERVPYSAKSSKFDFSLIVEDLDDTFALEWEYSLDLYEQGMISELNAYYCGILSQMCDNPENRLCELNVLNSSQQEELLRMGTGPEIDYPKDALIHWLVEDQAAMTPDHTAIEDRQRALTYRELDEQTNRLARLLIANGLQRDMLAAILLPPCLEQIVCILAVMKAGGAYLPIDSDYPAERIAYLLEDSGAQLLLTGGQLRDKQRFSGRVVDVLDPSLLEKSSPEPITRSGSSRQLAYVIYTSGSTGKPKGVMVEQQGLVNYIWWARKVYANGQQADFPLYSSISFDLTVTSIFTPLVTGGKIVIYGDDDKDLAVQRIFKDNKVQIVKLTPSHLKFIKEWDNRHSRVTALIVGGEQLDMCLASEVLDSFGGEVAIFNEYGPTETVVGCMIYQFDAQIRRASVPIGKAADNVRIYLLDGSQRLVPKFSVGEIYIAGDGVARGYLKRSDLTRERFVEDPFTERLGAVMYRTGDLARWLPEGNMEYIGRADDQVKIRGYRIELQEIQHELQQLPGVREAVVTAHKDNAGQAYLCAYVIASRPVTISVIRKELNDTLPSYMLPSYVVQVEHIPLTANGKVNFHALPKPQEKIRTNGVTGAPRNETEETCARIWAEVLDLDGIGIHDEFYELGGDSIKAIQISSRLKQAGISVETKQILQHQTIGSLCENLDMNAVAKRYEQGLISGDKEMFPIDHWFFEQKLRQPGYYHQSVLLKMKQPIVLERLSTALGQLVLHHDGLRLNYRSDGESLFYQNKHAHLSFPLETYELKQQAEEQKMLEIEAAARSLKSKLDIYKDLLIRAVAFTSQHITEYVLITAHHLVIDGVSWRILLEDVKLAYDQLSESRPVALPAKTASLRDWHEGLRQYAEQAEVKQQIEYWSANQQAQHGFFPQAAAVKDWTSGRRECHVAWLDDECTRTLLTQSHRAFNTEPVDLMLTAFARTMHFFTGHSLVGLELENHGRHLEDIDASRTIGWFTALFPLKLELPQAPLSKQIQSVKEQLRQIPDKGIGYGVLAYMNRDLLARSYEPAPFRFNYLGQFGREANNDWFELVYQEHAMECHPDNRMSAKLELNSLVMNGRLRLELMYHCEAYDQETIGHWMSVYVQQLQDIISHAANEREEQFTPSDFDTVEISQQQLDMLFK